MTGIATSGGGNAAVGRGWMLPLAVFAAALAGHAAVGGAFGEARTRTPAGACAIPCADGCEAPGLAPRGSALSRYVRDGDVWIGLSLALAVSFAAWAFRRWRQERRCRDGAAAAGGGTLAGVLGVAGCFLAGCCGSPMLGVYLGLFGASFLPFAKPLVAAVTALSILGACFWMRARAKGQAAAPADCPGCR